jgi:hypothetical protein
MASPTERLIDDESAAFWTGGLAVAAGALAAAPFPGLGSPFEKAAYLILGALVPAASAALVLGAVPPRAARAVKLGAVALFAVFAVDYFGVVLARLEWQAALAAALVGLWFRVRGPRAAAPAAFVAALLGFTCAFRLIWWQGGWAGLNAREPYVPLLLGVFAVLGLIAFLAAPAARRVKLGPWDALPLVLFAASATRIRVDPHEGAFFAGTVALLRHGAWLLWDAPSQYGFLNLALTAAIPAKTPWQALYLANAPLLFLSACAVYAALRLNTRGWAGVLFSALLAWAATLVAPGHAWTLDGPNSAPSVGAYRFLWCYILLAWAAVLFLHRKSGRRLELRSLAPGAVFWTLGCLWSFESSIYSTFAAYPIFLLAAAEFSAERRPREARLAVVLPVAALAGSVALISSYYSLRLGHLPDWRCWYEYAFVYAGGFGALPMHADGAVAALIWAGILIVALSAVTLKKNTAAKWLMLPAFGVLWSTASYFVSRSHDNNVLNLIPLWLISLLACFFSADEAAPAVRVLRAGALPLMTGVLLVAFSDPSTLKTYLASLKDSRLPSRVDLLVSPNGAEIEALLKKAEVGPDDGVVAIWPFLLQRPGVEPALPRLWLPIAPATEFSLLSLERQRVYVRRFLEREGPAAASGWNLEPKQFDRAEIRLMPVTFMGQDRLINPRVSGLNDELLVDHTIDKLVQTDHWRLVHFVLK